MIQYLILRDFRGSQDGRFAEAFVAGTVVQLSDYLASIVVPDGWARPVRAEELQPSESTEKAEPDVDNKAVITDGARRRRKPPRFVPVTD